jgi:beta-phosphoglucomutase-like phosphatase (HAD superfamily)
VSGRTPISPRAAIFDLDGTLVDSEPVYAESDRAFFSRWGIDFRAFESELVGIGTRDVLVFLEERFPESPLNRLPLEERIRRKDAEFLSLHLAKIEPFAPVVALARGFGERGLGLGLASGSSPEIVGAALANAGIAGLFPFRISADGRFRGKPEPDLFLEMARRLGCGPGDCLVVEDSRHGVEAARRAGMTCLALPAPGSRIEDFASAEILVPGGTKALDPAAVIAGLFA